MRPGRRLVDPVAAGAVAANVLRRLHARKPPASHGSRIVYYAGMKLLPDPPLYLAIALLKGLGHLPWRWRRGIGRTLGGLARRLVPRKQRIVTTNLAACFPELDPDRRTALAKAHFRALGEGLAEAAWCWFGPDRLAAPHTITGLEHWQAARAQGRGVILLGVHQLAIEPGLRQLIRHGPITVIYRPNDHPLLEATITAGRARHGPTLIKKGELRPVLRALRQGETVWIAADQDFGGKLAVFSPLFGVPASTNLVPRELARMSGAPVLPFSLWFAEDGLHIGISAPLSGFPSEDVEADARTLNACYEAIIEQAPAQWLWVHRRFKNRPPGLPPLY